MTREDEVLELQKELMQNPKSPLFTRLAELYISRDMHDEARKLVTQSLKFHPRSVSGLILQGRLLRQAGQAPQALSPLSQATRLAPDNWRAWLEIGEIQLEQKNGKEALKAFKRVLFLNPTHPLARRAVAKLELLTADEYEDDLFAMQKLPETRMNLTEADPEPPRWKEPDQALQRQLSFIDALIVRQETDRALALLNQCTDRFGSHSEIDSRRLRLSVFEKPEFLQPKAANLASQSRQKILREKKLEVLQMLLRRIELNKSDLLST